MSRHAQTIKRRMRRKKGLRKRILGSPSRPRLTIFRSARHVYAQIVDDLSGKTLVSSSTVEKESKVDNGGNRAAAETVGKVLAQRAVKAGVTQVAFDRNGFRYHGRIKALADAARKEGLKF